VPDVGGAPRSPCRTEVSGRLERGLRLTSFLWAVRVWLGSHRAALEWNGGADVSAVARLSELTRRGFDLTFAGLFVVAYLPIWAVIAVLIKLDSKGPVFERRRALGQHGRPFTILSFRTVAACAAQGEAARVKERSTKRNYTRVGAILDRMNLDAIPILLNVFAGDMTLVGPSFLRYGEAFEMGVDEVTGLRPGLICPLSIAGVTSPEEYARFKADYIQNRSFWRDMKFLFTVPLRVLQRTREAPREAR
jgi:lipopolysaccharide/colanic/teichoic acid biosynthesis glycosyltransferase